MLFRVLITYIFCLVLTPTYGQENKLILVDSAWANNSVNAVVFRKNSIVSHGNIQYIAFYDRDKKVVIGKRKINKKKWQLRRTAFTGNAADAHNMISIMVDGDGYLHMSWDHHGNTLNYARSISPGSMELTKLPMTGSHERSVSYPEFHALPGGDLMFLYRDGASGRGNLVVNRYSITEKKWRQLHTNLIDGENERNAYWQAYVDVRGTIHLSWVWRESADVASNHDMCYAKSVDGGISWSTTAGVPYITPITAQSAEYASRIPQHSGLINQTSMVADRNGNPIIATYFTPPNDSVPQYHIVYHDGKEWKTQNTGFRRTAFKLGGTGTKRIPIARPQVICTDDQRTPSVALVFRDEERSSKPSIAITNELSSGKWTVGDLAGIDLGSWEPTYDTELWKKKNIFHLFIQKVEQVDGEGRAAVRPFPVQVLQCSGKSLFKKIEE